MLKRTKESEVIKMKHLFIFGKDLKTLNAWNDPEEEAVFCTEDKDEAFHYAKTIFSPSGEYETFVAAYTLTKPHDDVTAAEALQFYDLGCLTFEDADGDVDIIDPDYIEDEATIRWCFDHPIEIRYNGAFCGRFPSAK